MRTRPTAKPRDPATERAVRRSSRAAAVVVEEAVDALGTMAAVNDAPSDGTTYGRKNGAWEAASGGSGLTHPQVMARAAWGF